MASLASHLNVISQANQDPNYLTMTMSNTESMFNYHGVNTGTDSPSIASTEYAHIDEVKNIIRQFLEDIQFDRTTPFT